MRKIISLLLLPCILLVAFTSCSFFEEESELEVVDDSTIETVMDMDNLITEIYSIDSLGPTSDGSSEAYFHVPQINYDSPDAIEINNEIQETYGTIVETEIENYEQFGYCMWNNIQWDLYVDDDCTFALVVNRMDPSCTIYYDVYNFNAVTGEKVENSEILAKMNLTDDEFVEMAVNAVTEKFNEKYSWPDLSENWGGMTYGDMLDETVSPVNINVDMPMFINRSGGISVISKMNSLGGWGYEYVIVEVM